MPRIKSINPNCRPIQETYINLKEGMEFKNYKELCTFLKQPIATGNSKTSQLENFALYFEFERIKNKYIIKNVYDEPLFNYSSGAYKSLTQKLLLDKMAVEINKGNNKLILSSGVLMEQLHMVNSNYRLYKNNAKGLKNELGVPIYAINDFYNNTGSKLLKVVESTLNTLQNQCYLKYNKVLVVCIDYQNIVADDLIRGLIVNAEKVALVELGCNDMLDIRFKGLYHQFNTMVLSKVNRELLENYLFDKKIDYYYTAYDIIIGQCINEKKIEMDRYILENKEDIQKMLNELIVCNYKESYVDRYDAAFQRYLENDMINSDRYKINTDYVGNGNKLIDYTVKRKYSSNTGNE